LEFAVLFLRKRVDKPFIVLMIAKTDKDGTMIKTHTPEPI
jgi:hypothetical protein